MIQISNSNDNKLRMHWIHELQVGDTICDCSQEHRVITKIENVTDVFYPKFLRKLVLNYVPLNVGDFLDTWYRKIMEMIGATKVIDRCLTLEGGQICSALNCCNPENHDWKNK